MHSILYEHHAITGERCHPESANTRAAVQGAESKDPSHMGYKGNSQAQKHNYFMMMRRTFRADNGFQVQQHEHIVNRLKLFASRSLPNGQVFERKSVSSDQPLKDAADLPRPLLGVSLTR